MKRPHLAIGLSAIVAVGSFLVPATALLLFPATALLLFPATGSAQCATCGNPSFASGSQDIARTLSGRTVRKQYRVNGGLVYGYGTVDSYFSGDKPTVNYDELNMVMNLFTAVASIATPWGTELSTILPFGQLTSTRWYDKKEAHDRGLGDLEMRLRQDVMQLAGLTGNYMPRIVLSAGVAAPTGAYVEKQTEEVGELLGGGFGGAFGGGADPGATTDDKGNTSKYLSLGRGVWWAVADLEAFGRVHPRIGYYVALSGRRAMTDAPDGFRWGDETRASIGANAAIVPRWFNASLQIEHSWRGSSSEVILEHRQDFLNGGGTNIDLMPTVQSQVLDNLSVSLTGRYPIARDVKGVQAVQNASLWLSVSGTFGFGGSDTLADMEKAPIGNSDRGGANPGASNVAKAAGRGITAGDVPDTEEIRSLLVPGKVTIVDYWATWCKPCTKLGVVVKEWQKNQPDHVVVKKFDASEWGKEHWLKYLPNAPTLPVMDIFGRDGRLIARLSGDEAFRFRDHLPEK